MNWHSISKLLPAEQDDQAINLSQLKTQQITPQQLPPLNEINNEKTMTGDLYLNNTGNNLIINDANIHISPSQQAINVNNLQQNNTEQQEIVDDKLNDLEEKMKNYTDDKIQDLSDDINGRDYVNQDDLNAKVLAGTMDAIQQSKNYTDTSLQNYARLDKNPMGTIMTTNGDLSLNTNTTFSQDTVTQYHIRGLPFIDLSDDSYRNLSQPLHAKQIQRDFVSQSQKNDLQSYLENRDEVYLQTSKNYTDQELAKQPTKTYIDTQDILSITTANTYTDTEINKLNSKSLVQINEQNPSNNQILNLQQLADIQIPFRSIWADTLKENFSLNLKAGINVESAQQLYTESILSSYGYTDEKILENKNTNSLDEIQTKNPLKSNLILTNNSYNIFVNDSDLQDQLSQQVVNVKTLFLNNSQQQAIVDTKIQTSVNGLKSYVDVQDQNLQNQLDNKASKTYVDNQDQSLQNQIDQLPSKTYVNSQVLAGTIDAITQSKQYTDTSLNSYARLDNGLNIKTTNGDLSLSDQTSNSQSIVSQYHLYGLPNVNMSSTNFREKSQPLSAKQLQEEFCSTAQKETLISDYISRDTSTLNSAKQYTDNSISNLASISYVDSQDTSLNNRIVTLESNTNQIKNSTSKSKIICSEDNKIEVYSNNNNLGYLYCPVGQPDNNFGIMSLKKLQMQSQLSSISVYGGKPLDTNPLSLNTHGFYITGLDSNSVNVQSMIGIQQGDVQGNFAVGHLVNGDKYAVISGNNNITLTGGLNPNTTDKYMTIYSAANKGLSGKLGSFEFNDFCVYSSNLSPTSSLQLVHKGYTDITYYPRTFTLSDFTIPSSNISMNNKRITTIANPVNSQDCMTLSFANSNYTLQTTPLNSLTKCTGSLDVNNQKIINMLSPSTLYDGVNLDYLQTNYYNKSTSDTRYLLSSTPLNSISAPINTVNMNGQILRQLANPILDQDAVTLSYFNNNKGTSTTLQNLLINSDLNMGAQTYRIRGLLTPINNDEPITKLYFDTNTSQFSTTSYVNNQLIYKMDKSATINNLQPQVDNYSCNNFRITNVQDPINSQDVVNKQYMDSRIPVIIPTNYYYGTWSPTAAGQTRQFNHALNLPFTSMEIKIFYKITTAVSGYSVGDIIDRSGYDNDTGGNGKTYGCIVYPNDDNNFTVVLGNNGVCQTLKSGGIGDMGANLIPFTSVQILIYAYQKQAPQILSANSIYTNQIIPNSNLNLSSYKFQSSATSFSGNDIPNVSWIQANTQVGIPSKIQNSTQTTSSIICNTTEITNGNTQLNMSSQKIINLQNGTNNNDAVNYQQLTSYIPQQIANGSNNISANSSGFSFVTAGGIPLSISSSNQTISLQVQNLNISNILGQQFANFSTNQTLFNRKVKISSDSSTITKNYSCYIDGSNSANNTLLYLDNTNNAPYTLDTNGNIRTTQSITCASISANSFNTPTINVSDSLYVTNQVNCKTIFMNNSTQFNKILLTMGELSIPSDLLNSFITCYSTNSLYGLASNKWCIAQEWKLYVPASSRRYKKNIRQISDDNFDKLQFCRFQYDKDACEKENISANYEQEYFGIIIEDLPDSLRNTYCYTQENGKQTVDMSRLKDDTIAYSLQKIQEQQSVINAQNNRINYLENQLAITNRKLDEIIRQLNLEIIV